MSSTPKTEAPRLRSTRDYSLFTLTSTNRAVDPYHMRRLRPSMEANGWFRSMPMTVKRVDGKLVIMDGQHRFMVAQDLGIEVWFVEIDTDFDIATINSGQVAWKAQDYATVHINSGREDYATVADYAERNGITITIAAAILAGTVSFGNVQDEWRTGAYKVTDRLHAATVERLLSAFRRIAGRKLDNVLISALVAVARVPEIDRERLIRNAEKVPERLIKYGTRDGALSMLELVYNYTHRGELTPLKIMTENAMQARSLNKGARSQGTR